MRTLGPFPIAVGQTITPRIATEAGLTVGVRISNLSGDLLRISVDSHIEWLSAFDSNIYDTSGVIDVDITDTVNEIANATEAQVIIDIADKNDAPDYRAAFPGSYPRTIPRTLSVTVNAGTVTITGTPAVTVTSGSVNIANTPTVILGTGTASVGSISGIAGTVTVAGTINIGNTPAVTISGTPTVNIAGTPSVSISGTPTVILGTGTASVGSISGIAGTVTVAGTINIGNTPAVTISGTPTVNIGNTPSVTVTGTPTVIISGTPAVTISGTPTVILGTGTASVGSISGIAGTVTVAGTINIGNTPSVTVSGTVNVSIVAGSVSITGTPNININSQSVNLNTQQPQSNLGNFAVPAAGTNNAVYNVPTGAHAIGIMIDNIAGTGGLTSLKVTGITTNTDYLLLSGSSTFPLFGYFVAPILSVLDTQVRITGNTGAAMGPTTIWSVAILDAEGVYTFDNQRQPLSTTLADSSGNIISTDGSVGAGGSSSFPVLKVTDKALWAVPNASPKIISVAANAVIVAAIAGQTIWIHGCRCSVDAAVAANWWRISENNIAGSIKGEFATADTAERGPTGRWGALGVGTALFIHLSGAMVLRGSLAYSQG